MTTAKIENCDECGKPCGDMTLWIEKKRFCSHACFNGPVAKQAMRDRIKAMFAPEMKDEPR